MSKLDFCIRDKQVSVTGSWLKIARLTDEWHHDLDEPSAFAAELSKSGASIHLLSFWQRPPAT